MCAYNTNTIEIVHVCIKTNFVFALYGQVWGAELMHQILTAGYKTKMNSANEVLPDILHGAKAQISK